MAYKLASKPNVSAPDATYPFGNIKDDDGTGNGTPLNKLVHADFHQFFAKLLSLGGVVGNDLPENDVNGYQFHTALQNLINASVVGLLDLKGNIDCSANPNYPSALKGDCYVVTVAGKIGGASGTVVEVGDFIIAKLDNAGGTEASVGTSWFTVNKNIDQATSSVAGIMKLYTDLTASNTDGSVTQSAIKANFDLLNPSGIIVSSPIAITDWNMFTSGGGTGSNTKSVAHGLTFSKIRGMTVMIRNDANTAWYPLNVTNLLNNIDATNVNLSQVVAGTAIFDAAGFSATGGYVRGYVIIEYTQ